MHWRRVRRSQSRPIRPQSHPAPAIIGAGALALLRARPTFAATSVQESVNSMGQIWPSLLILSAAAFVIERVIEILWNYLEWMLLNFGSWTPARLKTTQYVLFKSGTSLLIAAVLGILTANITSMRLFGQLQPLAPSLLSGITDSWDVLMTGILIGAATKPIHELIGLLTHFKNYLANNAVKQRELAGTALAEGVLKLSQSEAQSMIDVPGVGPTRMDLAGGDDGASEGEGQKSPTDAYIDTLHDRTSI